MTGWRLGLVAALTFVVLPACWALGVYRAAQRREVPETPAQIAAKAVREAGEHTRAAIVACAAYAAAVDWGGARADIRTTAACMALVRDGAPADDIPDPRMGNAPEPEEFHL